MADEILPGKIVIKLNLENIEAISKKEDKILPAKMTIKVKDTDGL